MSVIRILVLRFSAMGDVVLMVPVIRSLVGTYSNVEVTVATRPKFATFFENIERVTVFGADVDHTYNGAFGIPKLFCALNQKASFDLVVDLHDHVRTMMLRSLFRIFFTKVIVFEKGRKEKKAFTRKKNKIVKALPHTVERYLAAFQKAGFSFDLASPPYFEINKDQQVLTLEWLNGQGLHKTENWIGVAPFAMHATKVWPLENYPLLLEKILGKVRARFFLFGGGEREIRYFESLQRKFPGVCFTTAGRLKITQEIALMQYLDVMVCVDSANMHLASAAGVPVLSVWGGTHPDVGFAPFGNKNSLIQITRDELPCRPCSVYGRETCYVGGFPCLTRITPELLAGQVIFHLTSQRSL